MWEDMLPTESHQDEQKLSMGKSILIQIGCFSYLQLYSRQSCKLGPHTDIETAGKDTRRLSFLSVTNRNVQLTVGVLKKKG